MRSRMISFASISIFSDTKNLIKSIVYGELTGWLNSSVRIPSFDKAMRFDAVYYASKPKHKRSRKMKKVILFMGLICSSNFAQASNVNSCSIAKAEISYESMTDLGASVVIMKPKVKIGEGFISFVGGDPSIPNLGTGICRYLGMKAGEVTMFEYLGKSEKSLHLRDSGAVWGVISNVHNNSYFQAVALTCVK